MSHAGVHARTTAHTSRIVHTFLSRWHVECTQTFSRFISSATQDTVCPNRPIRENVSSCCCDAHICEITQACTHIDGEKKVQNSGNHVSGDMVACAASVPVGL